MLVAEVTTTDHRKTRCRVESKGDIRETRQGYKTEGYKIETAGGETACLSEEETELISAAGEWGRAWANGSVSAPMGACPRQQERACANGSVSATVCHKGQNSKGVRF